jgi:sensor histidine kinase YesM
MNLYLQLESLRVDNHFEYKMIVDKELDTHAIKIPPLIIQPYVENAIWHGLMHREEKGQLEIELYEEQGILCCKVTDNGVGRKKASELKNQQPVDHKSMGMQITTSRIELHQKQKSNAEHVIVTDLVSPGGEVCGTEVLLKIPINYD